MCSLRYEAYPQPDSSFWYGRSIERPYLVGFGDMEGSAHFTGGLGVAPRCKSQGVCGSYDLNESNC